MMKKKFATMLSVCMASAFAFAGCFGGGDASSNGSDSTDSGATGVITETPLTVKGLAAEYTPDVANIKQQEGSIDVAIVFDGTEKGWEALAAEYERLHGGSVLVNLNMNLSASGYKDVLNQEVVDKKTTWDIVQGNLVQHNALAANCINMYQTVYKMNAYAGEGKLWYKVLNREAYVTGSTGSDTSTYILNTENLQTAWFVNKNAMKDAGVSELPTTWNEMIDLCAKMEAAGYKNPLGISLDAESVDSNQFTWLLRVYGDYYYRNEYNKIMYDASYEVDLSTEDPESDSGYKVQETKFYNLVLDESSKYYVGANSAKYKDFISQFKKMEPYLHPDVLQKSQSALRNLFRSQNAGKDSPQIILDYAGRGLSFAGSDKIDMDFFDYPIMESEFVDEEKTLLRDVGGSGGYLSIIKHDSKQDALNQDFLKFVLSPYGQSIYYDALSKTDFSPNGMTTVKNDAVVVPEAWSTYFATDKITFTGLSDNNEFVRSFLRYLGGQESTKLDCKNFWQQYLTGGMDTNTFASKWQTSLMTGWKAYASSLNWNVDCYKTYGGTTN